MPLQPVAAVMESPALAPEVRPPFGRTRHPYFMHEMIRRQPTALQSTLGLNSDSLAQIAAPKDDRPILCVGTGTSFHAAEAVAGSVEALPGRRRPAIAATSFDLARDPERVVSASEALVF